MNGDPSIARQGSILPAAAAEYPQREIVNMITKSDIVPDDGDLQQLTRATRSQWVNYCVDHGSVNKLSVALDPPLTAYKAGLPLRVLVANNSVANATIPCTINVNSLGDRPVKRASGGDIDLNDLRAGMIALMVDDGTRFQVVNYLGAIGSTTNNITTKIPYAEDVSVTPNLVTVNFTPPITSNQPGDLILVKVANMNNSAMTIVINGMAAKQLNRNDGQPMMDRDVLAAECLILEYNTTYWQMLRMARSQVLQVYGLNVFIATSGSGNFVVPSGVFALREIELTGAGGAGGSGGGPIVSLGGGGNGGCTVRGSMIVTPGQSIPWVVGAGGGAGGFGANGGDGSDTTFSTWKAAGGKGGRADGQAGLAWGPSNGGTEIYSGQQGDAGWPITGVFMRGGHGGNSPSGGMGGQGSQNGGTNGNPGTGPGAAGGGGSPGTWWAGGQGSNGRVLIRY